MDIIISPTEKWLSEKIRQCENELLVSSPYINWGFNKLLDCLPDYSMLNILTRTNVKDFARGSSCIKSVSSLASKGAVIRSLSNLHAKVYVIDKKSALITSANATFSGLDKNIECGIAIDDLNYVSDIRDRVINGFGANYQIEKWEYERLIELSQTVENLKKLVQSKSELYSDNYEDEKIIPVFQNEVKILLDSVTGWKRLTLEGVLRLQSDYFSAADIYNECVEFAKNEYPDNNNPEAKIRQQLQELRDMGFIDFIEKGKYKRNIRII